MGLFFFPSLYSPEMQIGLPAPYVPFPPFFDCFKTAFLIGFTPHHIPRSICPLLLNIFYFPLFLRFIFVAHSWPSIFFPCRRVRLGVVAVAHAVPRPCGHRQPSPCHRCANSPPPPEADTDGKEANRSQTSDNFFPSGYLYMFMFWVPHPVFRLSSRPTRPQCPFCRTPIPPSLGAPQPSRECFLQYNPRARVSP